MVSMKRRACPNGKSIPAIQGPGLRSAVSNPVKSSQVVSSPACK